MGSAGCRWPGALACTAGVPADLQPRAARCQQHTALVCCFPTSCCRPLLASSCTPQHHTQTLLEHAPEGMAAADAQVLRSDPAVRHAFGACLRHAYCRGARGMARDVRVLGGKWGVSLSDIQCRCEWRRVLLQASGQWMQRRPAAAPTCVTAIPAGRSCQMHLLSCASSCLMLRLCVPMPCLCARMPVQGDDLAG